MSVSAEVLAAAIETYNEYRGSMATATLVDQDGDRFRVRFEGPFCRMCCDYDYFEDLIYELDEYGVNIDPLTIASIDHTGEETFVVEFAATGEERVRT
ncbi:hypothetical protein [Haladaptatus halobius]|uniref:hypothetical protein n=1 Tax=Haladaptatus halobius TaxID=2884875 RepID=UPI001D09BB1E|nr:hypothetical protein [Haladaptatus halobius]